MTDVLVLCYAAYADVTAAAERAASHGGSMSLGVAAMDDAQAVAHYAVLPGLIRPDVFELPRACWNANVQHGHSLTSGHVEQH